MGAAPRVLARQPPLLTLGAGEGRTLVSYACLRYIHMDAYMHMYLSMCKHSYVFLLVKTKLHLSFAGA